MQLVIRWFDSPVTWLLNYTYLIDRINKWSNFFLKFYESAIAPGAAIANPLGKLAAWVGPENPSQLI
ncbi:hypothetical protein [Microcoleus sp. bin38.metabat.b11b12b14.051]|uniref:hypothetical protein n=1 Tax=Microcoleus sp. bin38.metabat.b11b12b14.051 TaxID=2742709 RepID=UPI0025E6B0B6|nr:hypothetical protein [Microcoleus sp. bin38.metabat.b11b12b14.051]